jgi:subtilisin family serine protease
VRSAAAAVLVLALAIAGTAVADDSSSSGLTPAADGNFCSAQPDSVDNRVASAVDALTVSAPTTPPIAVIDTGIDPGIPEVQGRIVSPFDATTGGTDASDVDGHGSQVAGIAAASPGLMLGVSPTSPIMPIKIYNVQDESTNAWLIGGISWAVQNHAAVINISSATAESDMSAADLASLTRAISDAFNQGTLVVAAMGNDGNGTVDVPAALPHVLAVGASDLTGSRATFSNTGPWVDLVAPASQLVAPMPKAACPSGFGVVNGTSYAAPAVAGAAALLAQLRPTLTTEQRFEILRASAHDVAPDGRDDDTGYGLLDVQNAINFAVPPAESSPEVDDDPYFVRGANAKGHPTLLTRTRKIRLAGSLSPAKDPSDVYPVRVKKGERLTASATVSGTDSLIALGLWKPTAGDFDVTNQVTKNEIVSTGGFSNTPALKMLAKKTATYYLSVEAPDPIDPEDPTDEAPITEPYQLLLTKVKAPTPKPKKKHSVKKKSSSKKK